MKKIIFLVGFLFCYSGFAQLKIAKLKYGGGGDWYANKTALPNLINFCNSNLNTQITEKEDFVSLEGNKIAEYAYVYMTGHGNVVFKDTEVTLLRKYLIGGGFLHIDDNYGLKPYAFREMKKVFPDLEFVVLPFGHPIYHQKYDFNNGLPKIHEHDNKPPKGYGLIYKGRLVCFFSVESDLGNGWEDQTVYNDSEAIRLKALQMGANIIQYAFTTY